MQSILLAVLLLASAWAAPLLSSLDNSATDNTIVAGSGDAASLDAAPIVVNVQPQARTHVALKRRSTTYVSNAATPYALTRAELGIYLSWNVADVGGADLDSVLQDPDGCIVSAKDLQNGGFCTTVNGYVQLGGLYSYLATGTMSYLDNPADSASSSTGVKGVEVLYLTDVDVGLYRHLVFQHGAETGFVYARSAAVRIWARDPLSGAPKLMNTFAVTDAAKQGTCYGRFWNTFQLLVTSGYPLTYTVVALQSVTADPQASLGTTSTFAFEDGLDRPNSGC